MATATPQDKDTLSIPATLLYRLGLPVTLGALALASPPTALYTPFISAPTALFLRQRSRLPPASRPADLETLIWAFITASTIGPVISTALQGILSYGTALLVFGARTTDYITEFRRSGNEVTTLPLDIVRKRAAMSSSAEFWAWSFLFSFSTSGLPEELLKYTVLTWASRRQGDMKARDYTTYATMIGLGFGFVEAILFVYAAVHDDSPTMVAVTVVERALYGTAAHVLTSVLTGSLMAQRDLAGKSLRWWQILGPSTLYHGAGNFALMGACALDGHVGWVHPRTGKKFLAYIALPLMSLGMCGFHVRAKMGEMGVSGLFS